MSDEPTRPVTGHLVGREHDGALRFDLTFQAKATSDPALQNVADAIGCLAAVVFVVGLALVYVVAQ